VLAIGLLLGWLRWRSGSTALTLLLHALVNLAATVEAMIKQSGPPAIMS
jgi:membrane protease YdiL (CAAX protease family)